MGLGAASAAWGARKELKRCVFGAGGRILVAFIRRTDGVGRRAPGKASRPDSKGFLLAWGCGRYNLRMSQLQLNMQHSADGELMKLGFLWGNRAVHRALASHLI